MLNMLKLHFSASESGCSEGQFYDIVIAQCRNCDPGTFMPFMNHPLTQCDNCPAGKYASSEGSPTCYPCPATSYSEEGAAGCETCVAGHHCPGGSDKIPCMAGNFSGSAARVCQSCPPGEYSKEASSTCAICDAGFYCPGGTDKIPCPPGMFAAEGASSCDPCPAYWNQEKFVGYGGCLQSGIFDVLVVSFFTHSEK